MLVGILTMAALFQLLLRWKAYRFAELREALALVEDILQADRQFTSDRGKRAERDLRDLIEQLRHKIVRENAAEVLEQWKRSFASQPGPWVWVLEAPETQADRDHRRRVALHEEHIQKCLESSRKTKHVMNKVERWTYPPLR